MSLWKTLGTIGGGAAGFFLGGPAGAAAGATLGGSLGGLAAGSGGGGTRTPGTGQLSALARQYTQQAQANPYQTTAFRQGMGELNRQGAAMQRQDASTAFARGADGTAFEIAQGEERRQLQQSRMAQLMPQVQTDQRRQGALGLNATSTLAQLQLQDALGRRGDRNQLLGNVGQLLGTALPAIIG